MGEARADRSRTLVEDGGREDTSVSWKVPTTLLVKARKHNDFHVPRQFRITKKKESMYLIFGALYVTESILWGFADQESPGYSLSN